MCFVLYVFCLVLFLFVVLRPPFLVPKRNKKQKNPPENKKVEMFLEMVPVNTNSCISECL